ncbi:hypothetical protein GCM10020221_08310 [Streptomyces thioluteus]|uniref:Uncharacterized protein n=1 Tax=Streptomyces thioluteus TaxID=66431 RepID=A0ABN3WJF1_STRTU
MVLVVAGGIGTAIVLNKDNGDGKSTSVNADGSQSPSADEKKKDEKKKDDDKPSGKPVLDLDRDASSPAPERWRGHGQGCEGGAVGRWCLRHSEAGCFDRVEQGDCPERRPLHGVHRLRCPGRGT